MSGRSSDFCEGPATRLPAVEIIWRQCWQAYELMRPGETEQGSPHSGFGDAPARFEIKLPLTRLQRRCSGTLSYPFTNFYHHVPHCLLIEAVEPPTTLSEESSSQPEQMSQEPEVAAKEIGRIVVLASCHVKLLCIPDDPVQDGDVTAGPPPMWESERAASPEEIQGASTTY